MTHAGEGTRQEGPLFSVGGTINCCTHDGNKYGSFLKKAKQAKYRTTYDPAIPLLAYTRRMPRPTSEMSLDVHQQMNGR